MDWLIWVGIGISVLGLCSLIWSIFLAVRAKKAGLDDEALRIAIGKAMPFNMGGLFASVIGLMLVILGINLG